MRRGSPGESMVAETGDRADGLRRQGGWACGGRPEGQAAQRNPETRGALGSQLSVAADSGPGRQAESPEGAGGSKC